MNTIWDNFLSCNIDLGEINQVFIKELRAIVANNLSSPYRHFGKIANSVVFRATNILEQPAIYQWDIIRLVNHVRDRSLRVLYLRWTASVDLESSMKLWMVSEKVVDDYFENDIGTVACYKIPTFATSLSNEEFVFRFFMTILSSIKYAFNHALWHDMSLILFSPKNPTIWDIEDIKSSIEWILYENPVLNGDDRESLLLEKSRIPIFKENTGNGIQNQLDMHEWLIVKITAKEFYELRKNITPEKDALNAQWIFTEGSDTGILQYIIAEHFIYRFLNEMSTSFVSYKQEFTDTSNK